MKLRMHHLQTSHPTQIHQVHKISIKEKYLFSNMTHLFDQMKQRSPNHKCKANHQITWQMFSILGILETALFGDITFCRNSRGLLALATVAHLQAFNAFSDELAPLV